MGWGGGRNIQSNKFGKLWIKQSKIVFCRTTLLHIGALLNPYDKKIHFLKDFKELLFSEKHIGKC